jgi:hypothetical protein
MATGSGTHHKKPVAQAIVFGILSIGSYAYLFMNKALVMDIFTRGGSYAAFPIVTMFYFSFVHGAFASNVIDVLGLQAAKK